MAHKWTLGERKRHLREHYPEKRRKIGVTAGLVIIILLIAAGLGYAIKSQSDMGLVLILTLALIAMVIVSVFVMDTQFSEIW